MPRLTRKTAEARRRQILTAATACFARRGFHATTMQEICRAARLSPGSVYTWFPSKRAIMKALAVQSMRELEEAVALVETDPRAAKRIYLSIITRASQVPEIGWMNLQLIADARDNRFMRELLRSAAAGGAGVLKGAFRKLLPRATAEADQRALLLQAAALGIMIQSLVGTPEEAASLDFAERLISP